MTKPAPESSATSLAIPFSSNSSTQSSPSVLILLVRVSTPLATDEIKAEIEADVAVVSNLKDLEIPLLIV